MMNPHPREIPDGVSGTMVENQRHLDYQAGIREVVEWISQDAIDKYGTEVMLTIDTKGWQAKLKEWRI